MRERLEELPGIAVLFTTPLGMRIDEGLGGTPADLSVRIFGPDLDELSRLAEQAEQLIRDVDGITDLRAEQLTGLAAAADRRQPRGDGTRRPGAWRRHPRGADRPGRARSSRRSGSASGDSISSCGFATIVATRSTRSGRC